MVPMLNVALSEIEPSVLAVQILLAILIPTAKWILVNRILVASMQSAKIRVLEPFANVLKASQETLLCVAMTIHAQFSPVEPMLTVKLKEIELCAGVVKAMKVIRLFNVL